MPKRLLRSRLRRTRRSGQAEAAAQEEPRGKAAPQRQKARAIAARPRRAQHRIGKK